MTPERTRLLAEKARIEAELAKLDAEPDWEAWRPAAEKACEVYFSCDTDSDLEDMARALIAAAPLMPRDADMTDAEIEALACELSESCSGETKEQFVDAVIRETLKRAPVVRWPEDIELREIVDDGWLFLVGTREDVVSNFTQHLARRLKAHLTGKGK